MFIILNKFGYARVPHNRPSEYGILLLTYTEIMSNMQDCSFIVFDALDNGSDIRIFNWFKD